MDLPEQVDLVVLGTGLTECLLACAAVLSGKSVLILDGNSFFGGHWASLNLEEFIEWHQHHAGDESVQSELPTVPAPTAEYSIAEDTAVISNMASWVIGHELPRRARDYAIDLAHKALACTGPLVQAIVRPQLTNCTSFTPVSHSFMWQAGQLRSNPATKGDIFQDPHLSISDKRDLMRFMHAVEKASTGGGSTIFETDHFKTALNTARLPEHIQDIILYAIIQEPSKVTATTALSGSLALQSISEYISQVGAYTPGQAPFINTNHSGSELLQGCCRLCCVHGGITALRKPASHFIHTTTQQPESTDPLHTAELPVQGQAYVASVATQCGQTIKCNAAAASAALLTCYRTKSDAVGSDVEHANDPQPAVEQEGSEASTDEGCVADDVGSSHAGEESEGRDRVGMNGSELGGVARAIALVNGTVAGAGSCLQIVFPPASCGNPNTVVAWQCDASMHVCPEGKAMVYFSMLAGSGSAQNELRGCLEALMVTPEQRAAAEHAAGAARSGHYERASGQDGEPGTAACEHASEQHEGRRPGTEPGSQGLPEASVVCYFNQACYRDDDFDLPANVAACHLPDHTCTQDSALASAAKTFNTLYPDTPFLLVKPESKVSTSQDDSERGGQDGSDNVGSPTEKGDDDEDEDPLTAALKALEDL